MSWNVPHRKKWCRFAEVFHRFTLNKFLFHFRTCRWYLSNLIPNIFFCWNWKPRFSVNFVIKAAFTPGTLVCPTYRRELRHFPQDCNYITFSSVITWDLKTNMNAGRTSPLPTYPLNNTLNRKFGRVATQRESTANSWDYLLITQKIYSVKILFRNVIIHHSYTYTHVLHDDARSSFCKCSITYSW